MITPSGDPISLLALSVPMIVLYFVAILVGWLVSSAGKRRAEADLTRARLTHVRPDREAILARYDFPLDRFQLEAIDALDAGEHVVVAAPTGSGKTVVAEYGIAAALARRPAGVLHGADQGAVEPEVPRPRRDPRRRPGRAAHR